MKEIISICIQFSTKSMETYKENKDSSKRERLYWLYSVLQYTVMLYNVSKLWGVGGGRIYKYSKMLPVIK